MWESIANAALAAAAAAIATAAPLIIPPLRRFLVEKAGLEHILGEGALAQRLDKGALNLIENAIQELRKSRGTKTIPENEVTSLATDKVRRQFPETLKRLGMNGADTREFVKARVRHTLDREPGSHR